MDYLYYIIHFVFNSSVLIPIKCLSSYLIISNIPRESNFGLPPQ